MKIEVSTVKGFEDYLPPVSLKRAAIMDIIKNYYKLYGFLPIETPILEFDELMRPDTTTEDEAVADRFKLEDRGGRKLGLRYEFTFQLARIFKENPNIRLPFRRFQIGPVFRDEPLRQGRTRQFIQCDADIIGDPTTNAEAECLSLVSDILKELKINAEIQVNNRKLLNNIIESVELTDKDNIARELDKLDKIGADNVKANLLKYASSNQIVTLFKLIEKDLSFFKENAFDGAEELEELVKKCKLYNLNVKTNFSMVRGFSYYTGNIFELTVPNKKIVLAGGGRYDKTVGKFSFREIPAVGISFSLEAIFGLCEEEIAKLKIPPYIKAIVVSIEKDTDALKLARRLRKSNISCITNLGRTVKSLEYANSLEIPYAIFVGEMELSKDKFKLKDMSSGEEKLLTEKQLISKLSRTIQ